MRTAITNVSLPSARQFAVGIVAAFVADYIGHALFGPSGMLLGMAAGFSLDLIVEQV
jgi:hypothetical protein